MLETKPDQRMRAKEALEHEFLKVKVKSAEGQYEEADLGTFNLE